MESDVSTTNLCFNKLPIEGKYINQHKSFHYKQCSKHCKGCLVLFSIIMRISQFYQLFK